MSGSPLPPLPGADPADAPSPDDPRWADWVEALTVSAEGVDRSQIWASLQRTEDERLEVLERAVADLLELRGGAWPEVR
jgi:hypothetical protein